MRCHPVFSLLLTTWMGAAGLMGCGVDDGQPGEAGAETSTPSPGGMLDAFDSAARTYDVPSDLLLAIARTETGVQMIEGSSEFEGQAPAFGLMALRGAHLLHAAELAGLEVEAVKHEPRANVMAAAALLRSWADEAGMVSGDVGAWAPMVARYSGIEAEDAAAAYVHDEVYRHLRQGIQLEGVAVGGYKVEPSLERPLEPTYVVGAERAYATWRPSPNYGSRNGTAVGMVVIHTCEGAYSSCWGWLANSASGVSAHYVVNDDGSEIAQMVHEEDRAWHVGASYDCALNDNTDCWRNGTGSNNFTVGIEHAGYAAQASWSQGLLDASAQLVCDITEDQGIARDRFHIVGHGMLQPYNRTDPGANWPWTDYIDRVRTACGDSGTSNPGGTVAHRFVIDSNNNANVAGNEVVVSSNWTGSNNVSGYYNTGYWVAPTAAVSDAAVFRFNETQDRCYQVEAWWSSASDRAASAPFIASDSSGAEVGRVFMDQRSNGGQWMELGTWAFTPGWNQVALSRWTTAGAYVVADAVRFTESTACPGFSAPLEMVIDVDNALNGVEGYAATVGSWTTSTSTAGYYGGGYAFATTTATSREHVKFWFYLDQPLTLAVDAWWTSGSNRSERAPFGAFDADRSLLGIARVDQTTGGSQWNEVGTWDFQAGWNKILLVARDAPGSVVIADAVRLREQ
jgi:N-acetyl-anhydromuramyl-L-alanine amidase AmpD